MSIQEKIINDYKQQIKSDNKELVNNYKFIIGEIQRQPTKILSDDQIISILRKLTKTFSEDIINYSKNKNLIDLMSIYLPQMATDEQIIEFIKQLDFSKYKNKMQSMKDIISHFGQTVDGNRVKQILNNI